MGSPLVLVVLDGSHGRLLGDQDLGTFDPCDDDIDIPTINYSFVGINDLGSISKDSFCDVIGVFKSSGDVVNPLTKAGKNLAKRKIVVMG